MSSEEEFYAAEHRALDLISIHHPEIELCGDTDEASNLSIEELVSLVTRAVLSTTEHNAKFYDEE